MGRELIFQDRELIIQRSLARVWSKFFFFYMICYFTHIHMIISFHSLGSNPIRCKILFMEACLNWVPLHIITIITIPPFWYGRNTVQKDAKVVSSIHLSRFTVNLGQRYYFVFYFILNDNLCCIMAMLVFLYKMVFINSQYLLWRRSQKLENCAVSSSFGSYWTFINFLDCSITTGNWKLPHSF